MTITEPYGLHWFRRDLRIDGNEAYRSNEKRHPGRVLSLFCFDGQFLARPDFSHRRFAFFIETLTALQTDLESCGTPGQKLIVLDGGPEQAFGTLFAKLKAAKIPLPATISFSRDYEPFARARDARMESFFREKFGIETHSERDHLLIEPSELRKDDLKEPYYQVYTPFRKKWESLLQSDEMQQRVSRSRKPRLNATGSTLTWPKLLGSKIKLHDSLEAYREKNQQKVDVPIPKAGPEAALTRLRIFSKEALSHYDTGRDFPAENGTSGLSIFLKNGSITVPRVIAELGLTAKKKPDRFLNELIWREFYYHILAHHPRVETEAFHNQYQNLKWENDAEKFEAWKKGETGFPIVDAGMRQLAKTGWMHNRVRMIVASFLTKDLLIDWKWGEQWFMQLLLDGDLAPNNGGWQWAASTGCDPQPYFRIFNPALQGKRFDPDGDYIRKYIPELAKLTGKEIHEIGAKIASPKGYPSQIVDHQTQKIKALKLYKSVRKA
jgi:deoxyribodipyrimidine photo-lyase